MPEYESEFTKRSTPQPLDAENDQSMMRLRDRLLVEIREKALLAADLDEQLAEVRARQGQLSAAVNALNDALGIEYEFDDKPKGARAVAIVVLEEAFADPFFTTHPVPVVYIVAELARRGWAPDSKNPEAAVRSAIRRLRESDPRWRFERGALWFEADEAAAQAMLQEKREER